MSTDYPAYTTASFRIFSSEIDPEEITEALGVQPDRVHHIGEYPGNNATRPPYEDNMWIVKSKLSEEESLEHHLSALLSLLEPRQEYLRKVSSSVSIDFFCGLFSKNGFLLSANILKQIGKLGADLVLDIYGPVPREGDE